MTIDRFELIRAIDDQRSLVRNKNTRNKKQVVLRGVNSGGFTEGERQAYIDVVTTVKHGQMARVLDAFEDDGRICIVEDFYSEGTLLQVLSAKEKDVTMSEPKVLQVLAQLSLALKYLHNDRDLYHGEICAENILVKHYDADRLTIKLGSIGLLSARVNLPPSAIAPNSVYMAPELWPKTTPSVGIVVDDENNETVKTNDDTDVAGAKFGSQTDIWQVGCLVHNLCTKLDFPFGMLDESFGRIQELIEQSEPVAFKPEAYSDDLWHLVQSMLSKQAKDRPTAQQLVEHPLLQEAIADLLRPKSSEVDRKSQKREEDAMSAARATPSLYIEAEQQQHAMLRPMSSYSAKLSIAASILEANENEESAVGTPKAPTPPPPEPEKPAPAAKPGAKGAPLAKPGAKTAAPAKAPPAKAPPAKPAVAKNGAAAAAKPAVAAAPVVIKVVPYQAGDLSKALEKGDLMKLREVLKAPGLNLDEEFSDIISMGSYDDASSTQELKQQSMTALHQIADSGRVDLAAVLLDAGAGIEAKTSVTHETPLYRACRACQLGMVQLLFERGANVDVQLEKRPTSTSTRATSGDLFNVEDEMSTPLHVAVTCGHIAIVRYLLQVAKANCNIRNRLGQTCLHVAAKYGDLDAARVLIDNAAELEARDEKNGATALHRAGAYDRVDMAKLLIKSGANVDARTKHDKTPLHWAAENDNNAIALLLLDSGANIEAKIKGQEGYGQTALHVAASLGHLQTMRLLLDRGANIEAEDVVGRTPLLWACQHSQFEAFRFLLDRGADPRKSSADHEATALHIAAGVGNTAIIELLLERMGAGLLDVRTRMGRTPLHWACEAGQSTTARLLLERAGGSGSSGANTLLKLRDDETEATPLFDACWFGRLETVRMLLDCGANVNDKAAFGLTPLHAAAESGSGPCVELLVERGAKLNVKDSDNETALHRAVAFGQLGSVTALLGSKGINVVSKTTFGLTPLQLARNCHESEDDAELKARRASIVSQLEAAESSLQNGSQ